MVQIQGGNVTDIDLKGYVKHLFEENCVDIENSTVWEMAETYFGHDLNQAQLDRVFKLMSEVDVDITVSWE